MHKNYYNEDTINRFYSYINIPEDRTKCWEYTRGKNKAGYSVFYLKKNKPIYGHRMSYSLFNENIDDGLVVMHSCDNRSCVNPLHLSQGTYKDNLQDMSLKGRNFQSKKTHCRNGHEYTPENTFYFKTNKSLQPWRRCLKCKHN